MKKNIKKIRKKPMKILIVAKQNRLGLSRAKSLGKILREYVKDVKFDPSTARRVRRLRKTGTSIKKFDGDLIITIGGDGTLLMTASYSKVPILPIRIEGYGFLCTSDFKDIMKNPDKIVNKEYRITKVMRLKCVKIGKGKIERYLGKILHGTYPYSLNEIAFARKRPSKILEIEFKIDDTSFKFAGDGLIISTSSGSTAYSASAGGSLIDPGLEAINIVPLYPFFSKIKPMIIPSDKRVQIKITKGECALIIDGHGGDYVKSGTEFIVEKGEPFKRVSIADQNFYAKFKKKFME
jgi:NAD+ kinase